MERAENSRIAHELRRSAARLAALAENPPSKKILAEEIAHEIRVIEREAKAVTNL